MYTGSLILTARAACFVDDLIGTLIVDADTHQDMDTDACEERHVYKELLSTVYTHVVHLQVHNAKQSD